MDKANLDLYSDFLLSTFSQATTTELSEMPNQVYSHDQITRFLNKPAYTQKEYWKTIKPVVSCFARYNLSPRIEGNVNGLFRR